MKHSYGDLEITHRSELASTGEKNRGIAYAAAGFTLWGILPLYWKLLDHIDPLEIFLHRMVWACLFMLIVARALRIEVRPLLTDKRRLLYLIPAGLAISSSWGLYIWAVVNEQVVEASLGYFIQPLFMVAGGILFFGERLTRMQMAALALAVIGVVYFTMDIGSFPLVAIVLALQFTVYSFIKKRAGYDSVEAMVVETTVLVVPALIGIVIMTALTETSFLADVRSPASLMNTSLLMFGGVLTVIPLLLLARGMNLAPLSVVGFLSYLEPTFTLIIGVFVFRETFSPAHLVCFGLIWAGIGLILMEGALNRWFTRRAARRT